MGWWLQFIPRTLSQETLGFTPSSPSPVPPCHEMPSRGSPRSVPREPPSPRLWGGSEALLQINIHGSPVLFFNGEALPCCLAQRLPSARSSSRARLRHRDGVPAMETAASPEAVLGDVVMEPSDPRGGRGHLVRSFLRRHAGGSCALPVCLKPREREGPTGASEEGKERRVWGDQWWMAKAGGSGTSQHIHRHPPGWVPGGKTASGGAVEEQGLGT